MTRQASTSIAKKGSRRMTAPLKSPSRFRRGMKVLLVGVFLTSALAFMSASPASAGCTIAAWFNNPSDEWLRVQDVGNCEGLGEYKWVGPDQSTNGLYGSGWDSDYYSDNNKNMRNHHGLVVGPNFWTKQGIINYECDDYNQVEAGVFVATKCSIDWF